MRLAFFTIRMKLGFGVDLVVDKWARGLAERGQEVTVYCFDTDGETYADSPYKIEPLHLSRDKANKFLPVFEADAGKTLVGLRNRLTKTEVMPDAVIPASFPFYGAGAIFSRPCIHLHFGNPPTAGMRFMARANRSYLERSDARHMKTAASIITISEFLKSQLVSTVREKTKVIYPGCDHLPTPDKNRPAEIRKLISENAAPEHQDSAVQKGIFIALCVSRLDFKSHPYKGVMELAQAIREMRRSKMNVALALAGTGDENSKAALRNTGAIVFDAPTESELSALYAACDAYVTLTRWEGFDLPVAEAALLGKPVIALNVAAHPENAVTCPLESVNKLDQVIQRLIDDPVFYAENARRAGELAAKFNWKESAEAFADEIEWAVTGG